MCVCVCVCVFSNAVLLDNLHFHSSAQGSKVYMTLFIQIFFITFVVLKEELLVSFGFYFLKFSTFFLSLKANRNIV